MGTRVVGVCRRRVRTLTLSVGVQCCGVNLIWVLCLIQGSRLLLFLSATCLLFG
jgi:hypothetical protein